MMDTRTQMDESTGTENIPLWNIYPSKWQPRETFAAEPLLELAQSIREYGQINPVIVYGKPDGEGYTVYELVAGERRTRARLALALADSFPQHTLADWVGRVATVGILGLGNEERAALRQAQAMIPAYVKPADDLRVLHLVTVIENLDREGLTPLEEARAYEGLVREFGWSQRELAARVNKSQGYVAQRLSLLNVTPELRAALNTQSLNLTAARAIGAVPERVQADVTRWAVKSFQRDDSPASTRQIEKFSREITAFLDPNRWEPNQAHVYLPEQRNRLRLIRWAVRYANAAHDPDLGQRLIALAEGNAGISDNLVSRPPVEITRFTEFTRVVLSALAPHLKNLDAVQMWQHYATTDGCVCEHCQLRQIADYPGDRFNFPPCKRWQQADAVTCTNFIHTDDPTVISLRFVTMPKAALDEAELPILTHPDGLGERYVTSLDALRAVADFTSTWQHENVLQQRTAERGYIAAIQSYWEWQQKFPEHTGFFAHRCEVCRYYQPLNLAEGLPPCYLVRSPIQERDWNGATKPRAPQFALLCNSYRCYPRCEGFAFGILPEIAPRGLSVAAHSPHRAAQFIRQIISLTNYHTQEGLWGILHYLNYGRGPVGETVADALSQWLVDNFFTLGVEKVGALLAVALAEATIRHHYVAIDQPVLVPDLAGGARELLPASWKNIAKPSDGVANQWPKNILKPWELQ